ncbi:MAG: hypothetical protein EXQ95_06115 [Alphaproteobacteria bacterium]|nr:hypothetical protein [Alphaproteobacteria bacterium]
MRWILVASLVLAPALAQACADFGGATSSRWSTARDDGVTWLVTPCGDRFLSLGVNVVDGGRSYPSPDRRYHWSHVDPTLEDWARRARGRLTAWGFNTAGGWSLDSRRLDLPFTPNLELGRNARFHWFDPFAPETEARVRKLAAEQVRPFLGDPRRIGYYTDNEVGWWRGALFIFYVQEPARSVTKQRLIEALTRHYKDDFARFARDFVAPKGVASFDDLLISEGNPVRLKPGGRGIDFVRLWTKQVSGLYYRMTAEALRAADPEALVLGDRLPIYYDPDAVAAMTEHVDVISTNYNVDAPDGWLARYFFDGLAKISQRKPVLISEWFFASRENRSGNRNTGHLMTVGTQAERAAGAAGAARRFAELPDGVGAHWFQFHDHPPGGRADGEDYNFGLVDIADRPYDELISALTKANREAAALHAKPGPPPSRARTALPRAQVRIDDGELTDWPKARSLLPPLIPQPGEIAFGEAYAAWSEEGLSLALIGMDYYDLDLLAFGEEYPRSESFRVDLGVDAGSGPQRFRLHIIPPREGLAGGSQRMRAELCRIEEAACLPFAGAKVHYFGSDQPRITVEATIPWRALGVERPPEDGVTLDLAVVAWYRSRWMSLTGRPPPLVMSDPSKWRPYTLNGR